MKIVTELSGGADSTLATILIKKRFPKAKIYPIYVNWWAPYFMEEIDTAYNLTNKLKLKSLRVVDVNIPYNKKKVYVPLRNLVISAIASSYADYLGATYVISGSKGLVKVYSDKYSFYDSTVPFYKLLEATVNYAQENKKQLIKIKPILAENRESKMSKEEVYKQLVKYGINLNNIWNCFFPKNGLPCKRCNNCKIKQEILKKWKNSPNRPISKR